MPQTIENLLEALWKQYYQRVFYAQKYAEMVKERGGNVQNDHIALRSFNTDTGAQPAGAAAFARIIEPLGYERKSEYIFEKKKLTAWHWEHAENPDNPKIFVSQLEVDKLSPETVGLIKEAVKDTPDILDPDNPETFFFRPWEPPKRSTIEKVNEESQYAAWTLLHGNSINHFTAYINKQNVAEWPNIKATVDALREAGVPMKDNLEGEVGSKLCQSSTQAVSEMCDIAEDDGSIGKIEWSYAYYELAERGFVTDDNGNEVLFSGFLGEQATHLFEMTRRSG